MRAFVLCPFLILASCSTPSGVHGDLSRLRPWSPELEQVQPLPVPYVVDYEFTTKTLTYVAIEHSNEPNNSSVKFLDQVMGHRNYSVVLLEGVPRSKGLSPESLRTEALKEGEGGLLHLGEHSVAIAQAVKRKVPFVGAEPDEDLIKSAISAAGYSLHDLFGFYVIRQIPQWRRDGTLTRMSFDEAFLESRKSLADRLGLKERDTPDLRGFQEWYEVRFGKPFRVGEIRADQSAPSPKGRYFTQRIAAVTDRIRSEHILRVTEEMLNKFGRVLAVFTAPHFPVQQLALESMMGKPMRISDHP